MRSMTGYGSAECNKKGMKILIQVSSFNRKQADVRFVLPKELLQQEREFRKLVIEQVSRGAINVKIDIKFDPKENGFLKIDHELASKVFRELSGLKNRLNLDKNLGIQDLLSLPNLELFKREELDVNELTEITNSALNRALHELMTTKLEEGKSIKKDLVFRHKKLLKYLDKIKDLAPQVPKLYLQKLTTRIQENLENVPVEEDRLLKEVVIFADRCDISEETTRIATHLGYMKKLFNLSQPTGRKLDFLIQEIFREINTIGSKCNNIEISTIVIDFKSELERVREQVQNIE